MYVRVGSSERETWEAEGKGWEGNLLLHLSKLFQF